MKESPIITIIYVVGVVFGALYLNIWDAETSALKALLGMIWTAIFLIALFYAEKKDT